MRSSTGILTFIALLLGCMLHSTLADETVKPKVAVFPLGGSASDKARERVGFSLRAKLDREGTYEPIDGPRMLEIASDAASPISFDTPLKEIQALAKGDGPDVLIWGQMDGILLRVKVFDLRQLDPLPHEITKQINEPTDLRFVAEEVLQALADVKPFEHPNEEAVAADAESVELWAKNPNLVKNPGFDKAEGWEAIYMSELYQVPITDSLPDVDKVGIYRAPTPEGKIENVLAMNISKTCAENNGMACLSDSMPIERNKRYRVSFRYRSDGPKLHVFIKGYTTYENIKGEKVEREIYRRQVPPTGNTNGQWVTIVDDLNPQHVALPVTSLRVDLYAYLEPGMVYFDDITLKEVGKQTRLAKDDAIKTVTTRPRGAK